MVFTATIEMDNAAFEDNPEELSRILRSLADLVDHRDSSGTVLDASGATVGWWTIS